MQKLLSAFSGVNDTKGKIVRIDDAISRVKSGAKGLDEKTDLLNRLYKGNSNARKTYNTEKLKLPAVTWSGTFTHREAKSLHTHSGFIVLDTEGDYVSLLADFAQNPHIFFAFVSPSGEGVKPVIPVSPLPTTPQEHKAAFDAVLDVFHEYVEAEPNPKELKAQSDVSRLCFLAYDPHALYNPNALPIEWEWDREAWEAEEREREEKAERNRDDYSNLPIDIKALDFIPKDLPYEEWRNIGMAIKEAGLPISVWADWCNGQRFSSSQGWITEDLERYWGSFKSSGITWGSVVHIAKEHEYIPAIPTPAKLQHNRDSETPPTETLDANRANRETAIDTFFEADTESLHVLLVKDTTGTGKTHTLFAKARQHDKRPLAQLPHTDLAKQAVDIAFQHGFTNPFHLLGREHNWDDSGIAEIPVAERTADLFEKNNCLMCDQVRTYTEKRLAPRTYCEHQCPFLVRDADGRIINICPHLAQYQDLGDRDFLASCAPNLLFDLNFRGYLKSLVTATDEPSDEELAIDAMLGTESKETTPFNLAILDDYGISGLYADVSLFQSEFKRLKKAWHGTPTADFAKGLLKAFEKKKPHKIVKALRKAFDSTLDFHTDISENLTQHARIGIVEWVDKPKASKESKRMLTEKQVRYEDGGKQFIPVDFDAHKELSEKGIPSVNCYYLDTEDIGETVLIPHSPVHALMAGVSLDDLTPLWQKGATPIELIGIFLESLGNDTNAPIARLFQSTGAADAPNAQLTFSIPPQAPIGILPNIAMLSATTDISETKRAFDGQAVTFSEHTGGLLEWADGVQVYQYQDARLTSASVFDYPQTADGKRQLQETPIGLTQAAETRLVKLNDWAKAIDGLTAFISYRDFPETFAESVDGFDVVTHFDKVAGLNFDGLKFLVVFGYPKVKHDVVMSHARKQYASDSEPLPKADPTLTDDNGQPISEYMQLTQDTASVENGISIIERRFRDPRLEKIRHQLATEKLEQAIGRSRLPLWTNTITLIFTKAPIANISDRSTLFSSDAFNLAEKPSGLPDAIRRIQAALESGDVQAVMETKGTSQRQAYEITRETRNQSNAAQDANIRASAEVLLSTGASLTQTAKGLDISRRKLDRILNR